MKLLEDANVDVELLREEVESFLEKQPKVSGDTSSQKSMGRTLSDVLAAGRGVRDGLKVRAFCCCIGGWRLRLIRCLELLISLSRES